MRRIAVFGMMAAFGAANLLADFSYEQSSKLTGGMMAGMMKVVGVFSKQAREPIRMTVLLKGDRMASLSSMNGHIVDLSKETITEINFQKKTYSVVTFAEMAEALKQLEAKMQTQQGEQMDVSIKASVKETGQSKQIAGQNAREMLMTLEMEGTDRKSGQRGVFMVITSNLWLAPVAGYDEVKNFYQRMGQKLAWTPGGGMFAQGRSDIAKGMADLYKEAAKLDGVPVFQTIKMGFKADQAQQAGAATGQPAPQPQAQPQPQPEPAEKPSIGGAVGSAAGGAVGGRGGRLGGALGGLGGLGGLGRRKKQEEQPAQPAQEQQAAPQQPADPSGALMEMTSEMTSFSTGPVDASKLEVPAGFKQVESEMLKATRR